MDTMIGKLAVGG